MHDNASNTDYEDCTAEKVVSRIEQAANKKDTRTMRTIRSLAVDEEGAAKAEYPKDADEPDYLTVYDLGDYDAVVYIDAYAREDLVYVGDIGEIATAVHELAGELDEFYLVESVDWF